jgi:hypothetical protein
MKEIDKLPLIDEQLRCPRCGGIGHLDQETLDQSAAEKKRPVIEKVACGHCEHKFHIAIHPHGHSNQRETHMSQETTHDKSEIKPEFGAQEVAPKAAKLRESLLIAASVALLDIEENEKAALEKIRQEAGEGRPALLEHQERGYVHALPRGPYQGRRIRFRGESIAI